MFTAEERNSLRSDLLDRVRHDTRLSGAAITGSAAIGGEDRWSDVDLAFAIRNAVELPNVLSDWTAHMYERYGTLHHFDLIAGAWTYRVFLLPNTLQVDLAFVPAADFRPLSPKFRLVFGGANDARHVPPQKIDDIIGLAWLYALHARTCIARQKHWQAEYMISGIRDNAFSLASIRHGLPAIHGRGWDQLPKSITNSFAGALVRHLETTELVRAFQAAVSALLPEIRNHDEVLAGRLEAPLTHLIETCFGVA
jgi:hypothetical protein